MTIELRPWDNDTPRPSDARHVVGCWDMAKIAADQDPRNVRTLWRMEEGRAGVLVAMGGLVEIGRDGLAFFWLGDACSPRLWRHLRSPLLIGLQAAHERGIRRVFAIVAAAHAEAVRFVKALGFVFWNHETGWPHTDEPMLRYLHARPAIEEPALVAFQRRELELACLAAWLPSFSESGGAP